MAVTGQGVKHRSECLGDVPSTRKICLERSRLFCGGQFLVEEQIHDVFRWVMGQLSDGVSAVVNTLGGRDERRTAGADRYTTKSGVEVRRVDREHGFVRCHLEGLAPSDIHVRYKVGSCSQPERKLVLQNTPVQSIVFRVDLMEATF